MYRSGGFLKIAAAMQVNLGITIKNQSVMTLRNFKKALAIPFAGVLLLAGTATSCSDDDNNSTNTVTEADAVDAITASVSAQSNGVAKMALDAGTAATEEEVYTNTPAINCGQLYTEAYNAEESGANYAYDYAGSRSYELACSTSGIPQSFSYAYEMDGTYDTQRMYSSDNATADVSITGLSTSSADAVLNGLYIRTGHQESKVHQMRQFDSVITLNINTLTVNKSSQLITGGTAAVTITGAGSGGNSFSYSGSITFNGNQTATLVLNGNTYTINL
jgi:hypothetical protein